MFNRLSWLLLIGFALVSCTTSSPAPRALPSPSPSPAQLEAGDYLRALEETYDQINGHRSSDSAAPVVDFDAAASIPIPEHRTIRGAVELFANRMRESIQASLTRSAEYKTFIDKVLLEAGLPKALAYLPVIESGYSPTLTSRAGARGMWQFMPETAREYGMRVDWWVDERCDPERSTRAAARYLKDLHRQFGDWSLALAAYNAGPGRIRRALQENGVDTFWQLLERAAIPKETRGYVPTFYATLMIASDPSAHGFALQAPESKATARVELEGPVSLDFLAEVAEIDAVELKAMNPAYRRGILPPGRAIVRVPAEKVEPLAARAPTLKHDDPTIAVCTFTMRNGDSIKRISHAIGSPVETILEMNALPSSDRVRAGQTIYLPVRARELGALLASAQEPIHYAVRKGDTLYSIARRHNLTVDELRDLNDLARGTTLRTGQRLRVSATRTLAAGGM